MPRDLALEPNGLPGAAVRNQRMRALFERIFTAEGGGRRPGWRFLWIRPTYCYYRDEFFGQDGPVKFLLFSNWRFVPKAVSVLLSEEIERRAGVGDSDEPSTPLRFAEKRSFHVFDVCFPSPGLAAVVDPAALALDPELQPRTLVEHAERELRERLRAAGVTVSDVGSDPIWQVVARLDGRSEAAGSMAAALRGVTVGGGEQSGSGHFERHRGRYIRWMADQERPLRLSERRLRRLARIAAWSPAVSLLRAVNSVYPETREVVPGALFAACLNGLRNYLNRALVQAVINANAARWREQRDHYPDRVLRYCRDAQAQAVLDEYVFLLREVGGWERATDALEQLGLALGLGSGTPRINVAVPGGGEVVQLAADPVPRRSHFAVSFGEEVPDHGDEGYSPSQTERKSAVRTAFNSPFWPFVLATTSVGQEGLDFHLYCRDIVHWNLPSNPVDLEQREGRINRRDGLVIRRRIARDWPLARTVRYRREEDRNPWQWVFAALEHAPSLQLYKHGLYPHWVYESDDKEAERIRRHLFFYDGSADARRYERLKEGLTLYRLVFGQPRQQDLMETLQRKMAQAVTPDAAGDLHGRLSYYMINLSPFWGGHAQARADLEARRMLAEAEAERRQAMLRQLVTDIRAMAAVRAAELGDSADDLERLLRLVESSETVPTERAGLRRAVAALEYLRNPYDRVFDTHPGVGLRDDVDVIRSACRAIFE